MPRSHRLSHEGAWYHVMNRGLDRQIIFHDDIHREIFLELMSDVHSRYNAEFHAYCLMSNHYHLMIRTPLGNISRIMQYLDGVYTQRVNRLVGRDGPLFRGRFHSILANQDLYLIHLSRYIHLNPVSAKMVKEPEHYSWPSYRAYLSGTVPDWLCIDWVLDCFGSGSDRSEKYRLFMNDSEYRAYETETPAAIKNIFSPITTAFSRKESASPIQTVRRTEASHLGKHNVSLQRIADSVAEFYHMPAADIYTVRKKTGNHLRATVIYIAYQKERYTFKEIAHFISNISSTSAQRSFQRFRVRLEANANLKDEIEMICRTVVE